MKDTFSELKKEIETLPTNERERRKSEIMLNCPDYVAFLVGLTGLKEREFQIFAREFREDIRFFAEFLPSLEELELLDNAGDLRFHSFSLYALVRALKPSLVVETGVAHGKSSTMILLALAHNQSGKLMSWDLPPNGNLADGSRTTLSGREVGWLVPDYLRTRWKLNIADSATGLESVFLDESCPDRSALVVDIFFHDSLHTYDHILRELRAVNSALSPQGLFIADNMEMESGRGFEAFCANKKLKVTTFGNLGGARNHVQ